MNIAIIKDTVVINTAIFNNLASAQAFSEMDVWPEADTVAELPDGFGIGDFYDGEVWTKQEQPEPPDPPEPESDTYTLAELTEIVNNMLGVETDV